jgi:hypothetical protein
LSPEVSVARLSKLLLIAKLMGEWPFYPRRADAAR